jgi:hypothetical protein
MGNTVDSPESEHPPDPGKPVRSAQQLEDLLRIRKGVWLYDRASVAAKTRNYKTLLDLRKPALRTVDCMDVCCSRDQKGAAAI